ncbi:hypothetical protein TNCV_2704631 [Trichonephila clavipes]|nr:hypothetical protein TNCV_2704631 [Trichonephila clavipes]
MKRMKTRITTTTKEARAHQMLTRFLRLTTMEWYEQQSECCPTQLLLLKRMRDIAAKKRGCTMTISALEEKWRLENRERFVFPSLQRQNLLLLWNERSGGHLRGHVNTHKARLRSLENLHEVLESQRDSPKFNIQRANCFGSAYLDAL